MQSVSEELDSRRWLTPSFALLVFANDSEAAAGIFHVLLERVSFMGVSCTVERLGWFTLVTFRGLVAVRIIQPLTVGLYGKVVES